MNTEILTDEQAALLWSGDTASLANLETTQETVIVETTESTEDIVKEPIIIDEKELDTLFIENPEDQDDTQEVIVQTDDINNNKKTGRKPSDLVTIVNQLVEDGELVPFDDGEVKTIEDAKELIKSNIKDKEIKVQDDWWVDKVKSYSPQVQAILHYAEQGAKDITPLMNALSQIETTHTYELDTQEGQEAIIRDTLLEKGFDAEEAEDQINILKETGKLEEKATKFKPQLDIIRGNKVQKLIEQQEKQQKQAREASNKYLDTIENTLKKDIVGSVKLKREDKAKIFDSLAKSNYTSLNGLPTNGFVKALEEMQFGEKADYEHFLNIVQLAIDKESFYEKLRSEIKNEVTVETTRKLKESKTTTPNTEIDLNTAPQKKTISRSNFKNPFS